MKPTQLAPKFTLPSDGPPESPLFTFLALAFFSALAAWFTVKLFMD